MNFSKSDLPYLKWSLLAFLFSLIAGGSAIWIGAEYDANSLKERQAALKQVSEARSRLSTTESDLENMSTYAQEYKSLVDHKIIGDEQRLDWMEGLEKLHQQNHVIDFSYTIAPQQSYTPDPSQDAGNFALYQTGVNLKMDLLHEMQLIKFLGTIRTQLEGWFIIDHCTLERIATIDSATLATATVGPQLKADCTGGWVTMKNRNAP